MEQPSNQDLLSDSLSVNGTVSSNLLSAAKWGRFVAIALLIVLSLVLIALVVGGTAVADQIGTYIPGVNSSLASVLLVIVSFVLLIAGLLLFVMLRAYNHLKIALETRSMEEFTKGWRYLKIYFSIYGVLTLLSILTLIQSLTTIF